ncbi:hypothetical protein BGZ91_007922, partial [Linnemannia elongata]
MDKTPAFAVIAKKCIWISNFFNGNSTARAAIKRYWTIHKHGALSARRVAIPIAISDIPANSNLSTNGDAVPPANGNFPANDFSPVNGALPINDAPPLNGVASERKKFKELNVLDEIVELLRPAAELTHWIGGSGYSTISQLYRKAVQETSSGIELMPIKVPSMLRKMPPKLPKPPKPPSQPPKPQHRASDTIPPEVVSTVEPKPKCPLKLQPKWILLIRFKITPQINPQALTFFQPSCPTRERGLVYRTIIQRQVDLAIEKRKCDLANNTFNPIGDASEEAALRLAQ